MPTTGTLMDPVSATTAGAGAEAGGGLLLFLSSSSSSYRSGGAAGGALALVRSMAPVSDMALVGGTRTLTN